MRVLFFSLAILTALSALALPALADYSDEQRFATPEWAGTYFYPAVSYGDDIKFSSAEFILYCAARRRHLIDGIEPKLYIEGHEGGIDYKTSYAANPIPSSLGQLVDWYLVSEGTILASKLEPGEYNLVIETHYICGDKEWRRSEKIYKRPFLVVDPINISLDIEVEGKELNGAVYLSSQIPRNTSLDIYLFQRNELLDSRNQNLSLDGSIEEPFIFEVNNAGVYMIIAHIEDQYGLGYEAYVEIFIKPDGSLATLAGPFSLSRGENKNRKALFPAVLAGFAAVGSLGAGYYIIKRGSRKVLTSSQRSQHLFFASMRKMARQASRRTMDALDRLWRAHEEAKERKAREKAIKDFLNDLTKLKELGNLGGRRDFVKALQKKYKNNKYIPEDYLDSLSNLRSKLNEKINEQRLMKDNLEADLRKLKNLKDPEAKKELIDAIIASYPLSPEFESRLLDYEKSLNSTAKKTNYAALVSSNASNIVSQQPESWKGKLGRWLNDYGETGQEVSAGLATAILLGTPIAAIIATAFGTPVAGAGVLAVGYGILLPAAAASYVISTTVKLVGDILQRSECEGRNDMQCVKEENLQIAEGAIDLAMSATLPSGNSGVPSLLAETVVEGLMENAVDDYLEVKREELKGIGHP